MKPFAKTFEEACQGIKDYYSSESVQNRVRNALLTLRLYDFVKKEGSNRKRLPSSIPYIRDKEPLCPLEYKKYMGTYHVLRVNEKQVFGLVKGKEVQFRIHHIVLAAEYNRFINGGSQMRTLHSMTQQFVSRPAKPSEAPIQIHVTQILHPADP